MKYNSSHIHTQDNEIEVGKEYQYYESMPNVIANIKIIEDNSTDDMIAFKVEVTDDSLSKWVRVGDQFDITATRENIAYGGMWKIYDKDTYVSMSKIDKDGNPTQYLTDAHKYRKCVLTKVSELEDARVPNNQPEGKQVSGIFKNNPKRGEAFYMDKNNGYYHTSKVEDVVESNDDFIVFKTLNSIYRLDVGVPVLQEELHN